MAETTTLARPYAKAVFELAKSQGTIDQWSADLNLLSVVVEDAQMVRILAHPGLSSGQKADLIAETCGTQLSKDGDTLVRVLAESARLPLLPEISALFEQMKALLELTMDVTVESAFEIQAVQQEILQASLEKKLNRKVNMVTSLNKALIGGVVIRAGDLVIDASIKGRLNKLAEAVNS